jgi:hypothetical protein
MAAVPIKQTQINTAQHKYRFILNSPLEFF